MFCPLKAGATDKVEYAPSFAFDLFNQGVASILASLSVLKHINLSN
jgi:hypothetical protein